MADIILPDPGADYEYVLVPKRKALIEQLRDERDALILEQSQLTKPTNDELIEFGKITHQYYVLENHIDSIKEQIRNM